MKSQSIKMNSKFIIFVIFASLARCSSAHPLDVTYGLSEEELVDLNEIIVNHEATLAALVDSFNPFFDILGKYASILIYNLEDVSNDDSTILAASLASVKDAIDYYLNGALLAFGESDSDVVEETRNATYAKFDNAFAAASSAMESAASGNFASNRAQLEVYRDTVRDDFKSIAASVYDLMRTFLNTDIEVVLSLVEFAQNGTDLAVERLTYAVFNGIFLYADAVTAGSANVSLIAKMESYRENALDELVYDIAYIFGLLRTHYINSKQLDTQVVPTGLFANQFSLIISFNKFEGVLEAYFETITTYWTEVALGLEDAGRSDFSPANASASRALAKVTSGYDVFLDSILVVHSDAESAVTDARASLSAIAVSMVSGIYDLIDVAQNPVIAYAESLSLIEAFNASVSSAADEYVNIYFDLIRNGESWDSESEDEFSTLRDEAVNNFAAAIYNVNYAIAALATDVENNSANNFSGIATAKAGADSSVASLVQKVSAAGVVQITAA